MIEWTCDIFMTGCAHARKRARHGRLIRKIRVYIISVFENATTTKPDYDYEHDHDLIYTFIKFISTYIACRVWQKFEPIFIPGCAIQT
jgi:hypothetical protein